MERETKSITLPSGKGALLKSYITARERNEIRNVFMSSMKLNVQENQPPQELSGDVMVEAEKKLINSIVVSLDGSSENITERLLDGSVEDYDFVVVEAGKIDKGNFQKAK